MNWGVKKLGDVAPARPLKPRSLIPDEEVWHLNLDAIESNTGKVTQQVVAPISEAGPSTHWFSEHHVLYSKLRPYLNKVVLPNSKGLATTELVPLLPSPNILDRGYLAHYLRSERFLSWVNQQVAGAKMPRVSMKVFWEHEIPLPFTDDSAKSLAEQKRIAAILDKANSIRDKRQKAIALADKFLRDTFLTMFGDLYQLDCLPTKRFKNLVDDFQIGLVRSSQEFGEGYSHKYVRMDSIGNNGDFLPSKVKTTNVSSDELQKYKLKHNDFLFNTRNSKELVGKSALYRENSESTVFNNNILRVRFNNMVKPEFVLHYFISNAGKRRVESLKSGTTNVFAIYQSALMEMEIPLPDIHLQEHFSTIYEFVESIKAKYLVASQYEETLFNSLSQKAFKGEL